MLNTDTKGSTQYGKSTEPNCKLSYAQNDSSIQKLLCSLFVLCLCMLVWLRRQGFESSVNKEFQKKKLVNSKTMIYSPHLKGLVQEEVTQFKCQAGDEYATYFA